MAAKKKIINIRVYYGVYQPIFSVISKNANVEQKEEFVRVIEDTLKDIVKNGINKKALRAGINYHEFRFREADFGNYPRGLMYGLQVSLWSTSGWFKT